MNRGKRILYGPDTMSSFYIQIETHANNIYSFRIEHSFFRVIFDFNSCIVAHLIEIFLRKSNG